jgi:hypothetical protein
MDLFALAKLKPGRAVSGLTRTNVTLIQSGLWCPSDDFADRSFLRSLAGHRPRISFEASPLANRFDLISGLEHTRAAHSHLRPQRHDIPVRGARHCHRCRDRKMLQAPSGDRIPRLSQADQRCNAQGAGRPPCYGQLCDAQDADDQGLARTSPALACSLHTNTAPSINQVERWFAELTRKQLQRGVHRSTAELEADITTFIAAHNENQNPTNGSNPPTRSSPPSNASAKKQ